MENLNHFTKEELLNENAKLRFKLSQLEASEKNFKTGKKSLRESEEGLKKLLDNLNSGVVVHAPDTSILFANKTACTLLGLSVDQMKGKKAMDPHWKFLNGDKSDMPLNEYPINRMLSSKKPLKNFVVGVIQSLSSDVIWVLVNGYFIYDASGKIEQIIINFIDITERKKAEDEIQLSNSLLASIINSPDNIIMFALDNKYRYLSFNNAHVKEMKAIYGADIEIGELIFSYMPNEDDIAKAKANYNRVQKGERFIQIQEYGKAENRFWYELIFNPIYDDSKTVKGFSVYVSNITERKKAEDEIQLSNSLLASIINSPDNIIMFALDTEYRYLSFNNAHIKEMKAVYGMDIEIGKSILSFLANEEDIARAKANYERVMQGERFVEIQEYGKAENRFWYELIFNPIYDDSKIVKGFSVYLTNITERILSEEALKKSEEEYRLLAENSTDTIWLMQLDGTFLYHSPSIMQLRGYTPEEANNVPMQKTMTPQSIEFLASIFAREDKKPMNERWDSLRFDLEMFRKDGSTIWTEVSAKAVFDKSGQMIGIQGSTHNISERKLVEDKLKQSEDRFRALHNASFGGITIHDKGEIIECNKGLSKITGYSIEELIGMDGLLLIAEESREFVLDNINAKYEKPYEAVGQKKNGDKYPIRLEARMIPYKDKDVRVVEFRDISEQKKAEEELVNYRNYLEELVKERTIEVDEKNKKLSDQMKVFVGREQKIRNLEMRLKAIEG